MNVRTQLGIIIKVRAKSYSDGIEKYWGAYTEGRIIYRLRKC